MANSKHKTTAHKLQTAEEVGGTKTAITRAALGEIEAVIVVPFVLGHAVPHGAGNMEAGKVRDGVYWVTSERAPPSEARAFVASGLWRVSGGTLAALVSSEAVQAGFLFPFDGNAPAAPWDDWAMMLLEPLVVGRESLWFIEPSEEPAAPSEAAPDAAPPVWIDEAREHYARLKAEYPKQSKEQIADKIKPLMKQKGERGKHVSSGTILRRALQNLE